MTAGAVDVFAGVAAPDGAALVAVDVAAGMGAIGVVWMPVVAERMRYISALAVSLKWWKDYCNSYFSIKILNIITE